MSEPADGPSVFTGDIADCYDELFVPVLFRPWADLVAARAAELAPSDVLELAAGTGAGTRALRSALPGATLVATDLSPAMLDRARRVGVAGVEWQQVDAQVLPFADASVDVVVMLFGIMFVPDRGAAYREINRVLRPGGTMLLTAWDGEDVSPQIGALVRAAAELAPDGPPVRLPATAHGYHDATVIEAEVRAAGLVDVEVQRLAPSTPTTAHDLALGYAFGSPVRVELAQRGVSGEQAVEPFAAAFTAAFGSPSFDLPLPGLLVTAQRGSVAQ